MMLMYIFMKYDRDRWDREKKEERRIGREEGEGGGGVRGGELLRKKFLLSQIYH